MRPIIVRLIECKTAASRSRLPGLDWAVNPYRGCAHRCSYCYAQDVTRFETSSPWGEIIEVKANIAQQLKKELRRGAKGVYGLGTVTDPYQPVEKEYLLTRGCLVALREAGASASVLTKSDLVLRDIDVLRGWRGVEVGISIGCVDDAFASVIEPGAPSPSMRLEALAKLVANGIDCYVMAAPILPGACSSEKALKELVARSASTGVRRMMWDKLNPKPIASRRLSAAFAGRGTPIGGDAAPTDWRNVRAVLQQECASFGIILCDAF